MTAAEADQIALAMQRYIGRLGEDPPVYQFMEKPRELAEEIHAEAARGDPLTALETYRRLGMEPPPADAGG
jgi:hypothetical protein